MGFVNTVKETVMKEGAKRVDSAKANPVYVKTYNTVSEKICTAQETALFKKIIAARAFLRPSGTENRSAMTSLGWQDTIVHGPMAPHGATQCHQLHE